MTSKYEDVHKSPHGPRDSRPTALQIVNDEQLQGNWTGKTIFITGCSSGLGVETAKALYTTGATLYLTARDISKAKKALGVLTDSDRIHLLHLDLDSLHSVRSCAKDLLSQTSQLNIFIANAGIMATPEGRTKDGFESQFGTNHLSHFLLFNLLKPALLAARTPEFNSRVVILLSITHRFGEPDFENLSLERAYNPWVAYGASKTANLWTANEIERRYGAKGLHAWSVQPGGVDTGLSRHLSAEEKEGSAKDKYLSKIFKSPEQGAATTVWAAVAAALEGKGGKYLEDCQITKQHVPEEGQWAPGYATWAYDAEKEAKLWKVSLELVGLEDDA